MTQREEPLRTYRRWHELAGPFVVGRVLGQGSEFLAWILIARTLEPSRFGVLSVGYLCARYLGLLADWGASLAGSRLAVTGATEEVRKLLWTRRSVAIVGACVFLSSAITLGQAAVTPLALTVVASGFHVEWFAMAQGMRRATLLPPIVRGAGLVAVGLSTTTLESVGWGVGGAALAAALVSLALTGKRLPRRAAWRGRRTGSISLWSLLAVLAAQVYISLDTVLLAVLRTPGDAGVYAAVYRIPLAWVTIVGLLVAPVIPATAPTGGDPRGSAARSATGAGMFGGALVLLSIPVALAAFPLVFGSDYDSGRTPLVILLCAVAISTVSAPRGALLVAAGADRAYAGILWSGAVVNLVTNGIAIPTWGMGGAAVTTLLTEAFVLVRIDRRLKGRSRS